MHQAELVENAETAGGGLGTERIATGTGKSLAQLAPSRLAEPT
jgi:hypothetical protein